MIRSESLPYFGKINSISRIEEYTDENHQLTTAEIVNILEEKYNLTTHRTTIPTDIKILCDYGIDIITVKSSQNKYYIGSRTLELPEIKLLIDAVQSSKFKTKKKIINHNASFKYLLFFSFNLCINNPPIYDNAITEIIILTFLGSPQK